MLRKAFGWLALGLLAPVLATAQSSLEGPLQGFDEFISANLAPWDTPGVAIAIVRGDEVVYAKGFGLRDVKNNLPVTPDTLFAIGSCAKAFTTFVMGTLVDEGKLDWDTPVIDYIPDFQMYEDATTLGLTPLDLVTHRSGLPGHDLLWYNNNELSREQMVQRLRYLQPSAQLREQWQYNNLMFMTAGYLVETLTGQTWENAVRKRVLEPLQMSRSNFSVMESQQDANFARPYRKDEDAVIEIPFRNIAMIGPAGSINSSVAEMSRWLIANLRQGKYREAQLIQPSTLRHIHSPQMVIGAPLPTEKEQAPMSYAMGWGVSNPRGHLLVTHSGGIDGFTAMVSLYPLEDTGIVVLSNGDGSALPRLLTLHAADRLFGDLQRDWNGEALARRKQGQALAEEAENKRIAYRKTGTKPSHPLADYAGEYEHPGYGIVRIEESGAALQVTYNRITTPVEHWHYDMFNGRKSGDPTFENMKYQFHLDADGYVASMTAPFEPSVQPIVFAKRAAARMYDPAHLDKLVGAYTLGPQTMQITRKGNALFMSSPQQPTYELVPRVGEWFELKGLQGFRSRFETDKSGRMTLMLSQPDGVFTAIRN